MGLVTAAEEAAVLELPFVKNCDSTDSACFSCGERVVWVVTRAGRRMPVSFDGLGNALSHFATCPDADQHRRPR